MKNVFAKRAACWLIINILFVGSHHGQTNRQSSPSTSQPNQQRERRATSPAAPASSAPDTLQTTSPTSAKPASPQTSPSPSAAGETDSPSPPTNSPATALKGARGAQTVAELRQAISNVTRREIFKRAQLGVKIVSLETGAVVYEEAAEKLLIPASNMKLYTVAAALVRLSPEFRFVTSVYALSKPEADGSLKGDLVIYGRGDPTYSKRFFNDTAQTATDELATRIAASGVRRVEGDLIADESFFNGAPYSPGWEWDDLQWYYGAEISALTIEDNAVDLRVTPGATVGTPVVVSASLVNQGLATVTTVPNRFVTASPPAMPTTNQPMTTNSSSPTSAATHQALAGARQSTSSNTTSPASNTTSRSVSSTAKAINGQSSTALPELNANTTSSGGDGTPALLVGAGGQAWREAFAPKNLDVSLRPNEFLRVINRATTTGRGGRRTLSIYRPVGLNVIEVAGELPIGNNGFNGEVAVSNPGRLFAEKLKRALAVRGIVVNGSTRVITARERTNNPLPLQLLTEIANRTSPSLSVIAAQTLKPSQNLYTELILRALGKATNADNNLSSVEAGIFALKNFLQQAGIDSDNVISFDGSGLARGNTVTPAATVRLLEYMDKQVTPGVREAFLNAQPIAGVDGTLRNRMKGTVAETRVQAKTGTLSNATSLAGYVTTNAGERLAFALMINNAPADINPRTDFTDAIAVLLAAFTGRSQ